MANGLNSPHFLQASSNPMVMINNLSHLLERQELEKLVAELDRNVRALFSLGYSHYDFAKKVPISQWRQKISRLYYGVYNIRRSVMLKNEGWYSTDSSDHKKVDHLPDKLQNRESHKDNLKTLRADRNMADYSHFAEMSDLILTPTDAQDFADQFIKDCRVFLASHQVTI